MRNPSQQSSRRLICCSARGSQVLNLHFHSFSTIASWEGGIARPKNISYELWYRFGYRFRVGHYQFCSDANPRTLSILLWSYLILSDTHIDTHIHQVFKKNTFKLPIIISISEPLNKKSQAFNAAISLSFSAMTACKPFTTWLKRKWRQVMRNCEVEWSIYRIGMFCLLDWLQYPTSRVSPKFSLSSWDENNVFSNWSFQKLPWKNQPFRSIFFSESKSQMKIIMKFCSHSRHWLFPPSHPLLQRKPSDSTMAWEPASWQHSAPTVGSPR